MINMPQVLNKIFWGLLLVVLDFNIIYIDILPDFIGYFIIASALSDLQELSTHFYKAKVFGIILAVLSIPAIFKMEINLLDGFQVTPMTLILLLFSTILSLLHIAFVFYLLNGFAELAMNNGLPFLVSKSKNLLKSYVIISLAATAIGPFVLNVTESTAFFLVVISGLASIIVEVMLLVLIRSFRKTYLHMK